MTLDTALFIKGLQQFNEREFFDCHETLETIWREFHGAEREFIQGIIQIAVGYYHHRRGNQTGALKLLNRGLTRVQKFSSPCLNVDFIALSSVVAEHVQRLRAEPGLEPGELVPPVIQVLPD